MLAFNRTLHSAHPEHAHFSPSSASPCFNTMPIVNPSPSTPCPCRPSSGHPLQPSSIFSPSAAHSSASTHPIRFNPSSGHPQAIRRPSSGHPQAIRFNPSASTPCPSSAHHPL
ncbi:unnamed protein product [Absidia cylindrospora]